MTASGDERGATQHPGAHLVTSTMLNPSSFEMGHTVSRGASRHSRGKRIKLEGMLRKERIKECYQLGLQVHDHYGRPMTEEEKRKMKKKAVKLARYASDKKDDLSEMGVGEVIKQGQRPPSRGMDTARSALSHYNVLQRYKNIRERRKSHPAPLQHLHDSEGAMHSRDVFKEREREAGLRDDRPITPSAKGCSTVQAGAMVRERLRAMLMDNTAAVRAVFNELDRDNDGVLNPSEFHGALHAIGLPLTKPESFKFMQRFLDGGGGKKEQLIDFHDFFTKVVGLPHDLSMAHPRIGKKSSKVQMPTEKTRMTENDARKWFLAQIRLQVLNVPHCLSRVFNVMDPDHSGTIDTEELREGLRKIGLWLKEDELRQLFAVYDEDQSGAIDYQEFIAEILGIPSVKSMRKKQRADAIARGGGTPQTEEVEDEPAKGTIRARELQCIIRQKLERAIADPAHLREVFSRLDSDGSGVLTFDDFSAACDSFGMIVSDEVRAKIFHDLDPGKAGCLTYSDFINHVALVPHDIVDVPHPSAPEARVSTPQVVDEIRDRLKERVMCKRDGIEKLFLSFNQDKRKSISYGAFCRTLNGLGLPLNDFHLKSLWQMWGGVTKGHIDLTGFVDNVLEFSLDKPALSSVPITGYASGTPMPDPVPRLVPVFDAGRSSVTPGEPHFRQNSARKSTLMVPFLDSKRPVTAPAKSGKRSVQRFGASLQGAGSVRSDAGAVGPRPMSSMGSSSGRHTLRSLQTPRSVGSVWSSSNKITA